MKEHGILGCGEWYDERHRVLIRWYDEREPRLVRHEVFHGPYRQKSIELGLYVFLTPESHNMSDYAVHFNRPFESYLKSVSQVRAMEHYGWSVDDFIQRFGRSYI